MTTDTTPVQHDPVPILRRIRVIIDDAAKNVTDPHSISHEVVGLAEQAALASLGLRAGDPLVGELVDTIRAVAGLVTTLEAHHQAPFTTD